MPLNTVEEAVSLTVYPELQDALLVARELYDEFTKVPVDVLEKVRMALKRGLNCATAERIINVDEARDLAKNLLIKILRRYSDVTVLSYLRQFCGLIDKICERLKARGISATNLTVVMSLFTYALDTLEKLQTLQDRSLLELAVK